MRMSGGGGWAVLFSAGCIQIVQRGLVAAAARRLTHAFHACGTLYLRYCKYVHTSSNTFTYRDQSRPGSYARNNQAANSNSTHLISHAPHVAHGVFAGTLVVALVVEVRLGRTPALEPELESHERGALSGAVLQAHL